MTRGASIGERKSYAGALSQNFNTARDELGARIAGAIRRSDLTGTGEKAGVQVINLGPQSAHILEEGGWVMT